jgi:uncharacterized protein YidB (DUF937 family)
VRAWRTPGAAAVSHARLGRVLVPLWPDTGLPARKWAHLTATLPGAVAACWPGPMYNPGIIPWLSGLVVIDLDSAEHGGTLPAEWADTGAAHGSDVLAVLADRARQKVPATYEVRTPRRGTHLYFQAPAGQVIGNSAGRIGPMIDVRGRGGLVVGAGSVKNGRLYELADERDPVPLPGWLAELAAAPQRAPADPRPVREGSAFGRLRGALAVVLSAKEGQRNNCLHWAACRAAEMIAAGDVSESAAEDALTRAAQEAGLEPGEIRTTIASAFRRVMA